MQLHLLLESKMIPSIPDSIKIKHDFGHLRVVFPENNFSLFGQHVIMDGPEADFVEWLMPFDGFAKGNGTPCFESFEIVHIRKEKTNDILKNL